MRRATSGSPPNIMGEKRLSGSHFLFLAIASLLVGQLPAKDRPAGTGEYAESIARLNEVLTSKKNSQNAMAVRFSKLRLRAVTWKW